MHPSRFLTIAAAAVIGFTLVGCKGVIDPRGGQVGYSGHEGHETIDAASKGPYDKAGFTTILAKGNRLWVFESGSEDLAKFREHGEPAKLVTLIGEGPLGMTLKGPSTETLNKYLVAAQGFYTSFDKSGRIWVFEADSEGLEKFLQHGEPAKMVSRIGEGPMGKTVKSDSSDTIDAYLAAVSASRYVKPGWHVLMDGKRVWVHPVGSEELSKFLEHGEPAKMATLIGAGPFNTTVKSTNITDAESYIAAAPGFYTSINDEGRIWVFKEGSEDLAKFLEHGEPAKLATAIGEGPMGRSVKSADLATIQAYLKAPK